MIQLVVPDLGEGVLKVEIAAWHFPVSSVVTPDDDIVELVTDKASFCVPAPVRGVLVKIHINEGQEVPIGTVLADIEPL
jgi:pyruvate/2-oxoglutarate dehydrogenase complex dihydrolipoamide acyltransferase (E2) component